MSQCPTFDGIRTFVVQQECNTVPLRTRVNQWYTREDQRVVFVELCAATARMSYAMRSFKTSNDGKNVVDAVLAVDMDPTALGAVEYSGVDRNREFMCVDIVDERQKVVDAVMCLAAG